MKATAAIALVLLLAVAACSGGDDGNGEEAASTPSTATATAPRATTTAEEAPPAPLPPSSFAAQPAPYRVVLTWEPPPEEVERFELYRDGDLLSIQPGSTTEYTDVGVRPGTVYNYEIASQNGDLLTGRLHASAETPLPPLRAARVAGTFNVSTRVASQSGYSEYRANTFGWQFRPRCGEGACDVRWRDLHLKRLRTVLARTGARYRGELTARFLIECAGSAVTSAIDLDLKVDKARVIGDEWRATRLVGSLEHSEASQLGCGYSQARLTVRARLVQ